MLKKAITFCWILFFVTSCDKQEDFLFDESIHKGEMIASSGDSLSFRANFTMLNNSRTGLYSITGLTNPVNAFNKPQLHFEIRVIEIALGCQPLVYAPAFPINDTITYSHAITTLIEGDSGLGKYMIREDSESWVCIDEISHDGREISGTFELHMFKPPVQFSWLQTRWPDSLSLTEGSFRAFGREPQ